MFVKAKISFAGAFTMQQGEVKECNDEVVLQDLIQAGYVEPVKEEVAPVQQETPSEGVEKNESKRNNTTKRSKLSKN